MFLIPIFPSYNPRSLLCSKPRLTLIFPAVGFYAGLNLIAFFMIFCFVRETKQLTLEEIDQVFSVPTSTFIKYEATVTVPWLFKHYILRKDIPRPAQLIQKEEFIHKD